MASAQITSKHVLQRYPTSNNYPAESDLPSNVTRHFIETQEGRLEMLVAEPPAGKHRHDKILIFQHGGLGSAWVWLPYMTYLSQQHGYPCYAISSRGHGASWIPGFFQMWFMTKVGIAQDVMRAIEWARRREGRNQNSNLTRVVLVGHSMGGGVVQYLVSHNLARVDGLILCGAAPTFGMHKTYINWVRLDPFIFLRFLSSGLHVRSLLPTTTHVHRAWFSPEYPSDKLQEVMKYMPEIETFFCGIELCFPFASCRHIVQNLLGWSADKLESQKILVISGSADKLMDPSTMHQLSKCYRDAIQYVMPERASPVIDTAGDEDNTGKLFEENQGSGIRMVVVNGAGHHIQNDIQWEIGAERVADFLQQL